ncbi:hypothetical protein [Granulicella aggregans]|uniref:hypothetical protein n=1 Tax=Granulicella aggregans TaxID=474949 RepID=UPI0021E08D63|nr:hypothetical protein [Granulicella aggregans]
MSRRTFCLIALSGITAGVLVVTVSALAQAPAGSNWDHLKALPAQTRIHVSADKGGATCKLLSVDDATLVCGKHTFQRANVKSVKLTRYGISTAIGAGIGAGVGVGVGVGLAVEKTASSATTKESSPLPGPESEPSLAVS